MKRIIYDYENPHIVGRAKRSFPLAKVIVAIIVISLVIALIYILFFRGTTPRRHESREYFVVVAGVYDSEDSAMAAATQIKARGGGGFVYDDGSFFVISSVYPDEADADSVAVRYGYTVMSTGKYSFESDTEQKEFFTLPEDVFSVLYKTSISLDKGELSESAALHALASVEGEIEDKKSDLVSLKEKSSSDKLLTRAVQMYDKLIDALGRDSAYSVSSRLKYCLVEVTYIYKNFLNSIS